MIAFTDEQYVVPKDGSPLRYKFAHNHLLMI